MEQASNTRRYKFIFHDERGLLREDVFSFAETTSAKSKAGRIARARGTPVDLAFAGDEDWNERYISTAMPCEYSTTGFRFERIS